MTKDIKVMIIDDSSLMRKMLIDIIETDPDNYVIATATNGAMALQKLQTILPDIIVLDLEMPEMDGIEFLKKMNLLKMTIPVIILSAVAKKNAAITIEALELGAKDFILKPAMGDKSGIEKMSMYLRSQICIYSSTNQNSKSKMDCRNDLLSENLGLVKKAVADLRKMTDGGNLNAQFPFTEDLPPAKNKKRKIAKPKILAIGISTGGPFALRSILPSIRKDFPLPIVIVQHMPEGFTKEFAESLDDICSIKISEGKHGEMLKPGHAYVAPGNIHMEVEQIQQYAYLSMNEGEQVNGHRPSVDLLFRSIKKCYGAEAIAVIMTGMGRDGAKGLGELYNSGARTIAQTEGSCVVYGMPRVAIECGYAEFKEPLSNIVSRIYSILEESASL